MPLIIPTLTQGLIFSLLAIGIAITYRVYRFPDLSVDGSVTTGAAVAIVLIHGGMAPLGATLCGALAGFAAGTITGMLHAVFHVNRLLAGILVMSSLYSINLHIMGASGLVIQDERTLVTLADEAGMSLSSGAEEFLFAGQSATPGEVMMALFALGFAVLALAVFAWMFRTNLGLAVRAAGDNERMMRAQGVNTGAMFVLATAGANALAAATGAVYAQYVYSVDIALGIGMVIRGLAYVIIGQTIIRGDTPGRLLLSAAVGAIAYEILLAIILQIGDLHNDLRLITAVFVLLALGSQELLRAVRRSTSTAASK